LRLQSLLDNVCKWKPGNDATHDQHISAIDGRPASDSRPEELESVVQGRHNRKPVGSSRFLFWKKEAYQGNGEQQALSFDTAHDRVHAAVVLLWRGEFPQKQFFTYKPGNASGKYNYYGVRNGERRATTYNYGDPYRQLESDIDWPILAFSQEEQDFAASRTMASPGSEAEVIGNSWP
jgi:hypothetical protein